MSQPLPRRIALSPEAFAVLGGSRIAYVKVVRSEDVSGFYPGLPPLISGQRLYALHAADGTPIALNASREAAISDARGHRLETVSVH